MSLREWLVLIGVVVIVGVLADGYRRMRLARKRASELSFGLEKVKGFDEEFSSELPNGGARKRHSAEEQLETRPEKPELAQRLKKRFRSEDKDSRERGKSQERLSNHERAERIEPEITGMAFGESGESGDNAEAEQFSPLSRDDQIPAMDDEVVTAQAGFDFEEPVPVLVNVDPEQKRPKKAVPARSSRSVKEVQTEIDLEGLSPEPVEPVQQAAKQQEAAKVEKPVMAGQEKLADRPKAEEVLVINVLAKGDNAFDGARLLQSLLNFGLRFGEMSIFHRHDKTDGTGKIQYSLANGVEPGYFDIEDLENTATPAVSFFMSMPGPEQPMKAFTLMEEAARQLALDLGGELKDEHYSVMTQQTLEHCRQRIRDYERKQLTQKHTS